MWPPGILAEAFALGLSSGPACLASCGPVLVPVLAAQRDAPRATGMVLAEFLAGRLGGYLAFACLAWAVGAVLAGAPRTRLMTFGIADLATAALLASYAHVLRRTATAHGTGQCPVARAHRLDASFGAVAPVILGFVTGLSLCRPFVAAVARAAKGPGLAGALIFFAAFFLGTSLWLLPSLGVSLLRRFDGVSTVARLVLFVLAAYYAYMGLILLGGLVLHG